MPKQQPDLYPGIMTSEQMLAKLGWTVPMMSEAALAAFRAQPGGDEPFDPDDDGPRLDEFGEPVYPGDSGSP